MRVVVAGCGIFGVTAALALRHRGHEVAVVDAGPVPHPLAESTDISKVVRLDYGADEHYTALAERALEGWRAWNAGWPAPLFHETGVAFLTRAPMAPGGFEHDSFELLRRRRHVLERLDAATIARRFPAYREGALVDGYYNPAGGWVESGQVVTRLVAQAAALGVEVAAGRPARRVVERGGRAVGLELDDGLVREADAVVVAAGAWTALLCPWVASAFKPVGQTVFHLRPARPESFRALAFPVFGADIARTGYYGFPLHEGVVKIGNHGVGVPVDMTSAQRTVPPGEERALQHFLRDVIPGLAGAEIAARRLCVYCDTLDEHFWIAPDPDRPGLVVATGGSGHAFKFAPVLGDLVADAVEGRTSHEAARFRWRADLTAGRGEEAARARLHRTLPTE